MVWFLTMLFPMPLFVLSLNNGYDRLFFPKMGSPISQTTGKGNFPDDLKMFPYYLRQAGYHTTNNSKTDYNVNIDYNEVWDTNSKKATWRTRSKGQPFFHMRTFTDSHESNLHAPKLDLNTEKGHDPERMTLPPHYPQTKTFKSLTHTT